MIVNMLEAYYLWESVLKFLYIYSLPHIFLNELEAYMAFENVEIFQTYIKISWNIKQKNYL